MISRKKFTLKETADTIRKRLKDRFKGTKFSVRTERFCTGNTAIHIRWTGGPSRDEIDKATEEFGSSRFDSRSDYWEYCVTTDYVDADGNIEIVEWDADFISTCRHLRPGEKRPELPPYMPVSYEFPRREEDIPF